MAGGAQPDVEENPLSALPAAAGERVKSRRAQPLAENAYETIKARILAFDLPPGKLVSAQGLASELGTSVTPVHWALKRLCVEGLCEVKPRLGYVVTSGTAIDVQEIFGLRLALEPLAVELGMRRSAESDLASFREEVYRPMPPPREAPGDMGRVWLANAMADHHDAFHLAVARLSGWPRLESMIRDLLESGRRLTWISAAALPADERSEEREPGPAGAHRTITDAILSRDRGAAIAAMADHVRAGHRRVVDFMSSIPVDPLAAGGAPPTLDP